MSTLTAGSYDQHRSCEVGQTVIATLDDGTTVSGTVVDHVDETVYVASDTGGMLEFRRATDSTTQEKAIMMGVDGTDVTDRGIEASLDSDGTYRKTRKRALSYDHRVVEFEAETQEVVIGEESVEK